MKPVLTLLLIFGMAAVFAQPSENLNLKFSGDLYYSRVPGTNKSVRMTLNDKLASVLVIATDNSSGARLQREQPFLNGQGKRAYLVAFPILYRFSTEGNVLTFFFGEKGAENDVDQAVVKVSYQGSGSSSGRSMNRQSLIFPVQQQEIFSVPLSGTPSGEIAGKQFLLVDASAEKTATFKINREEQRGNVLVGIFSQKTGNLLTTLNPKDPDNQAPELAFTVDEPVLVIPVIRPAVKTNNTIDTVSFEVGDPREVATVTVTEE